MWIVRLALRRPYTVMMAMLAIILGTCLAWSRMKVDIFPALNLPVIYVAQPYGGLDPAQMEGLITNYYEYLQLKQFQSRTGSTGHSDLAISVYCYSFSSVSIPNGLHRPFRLACHRHQFH